MEIEPLEFEKPVYDIQRQLDDLRKKSSGSGVELDEEIEKIKAKLEVTKKEVYQNLTPWQRVQIARHTARPFMLDYVEHCFSEFVELHGDRHIGDDTAMPGGFARLNEHRCAVIGHQKGRNTKENLHRNFGSAHPEGYRKALRLFKLAEKFGHPVVTLIDTPGAFPGIGAEERNIAEAIAFNLREMANLRTPIVSIVIGEGGSGGALGIGIADCVIMLENAYYSVISPEGCAAILWKDRKFASEAAEAMRITASHLQELGIVDVVVPEPYGGAHYDHETTAKSLSEAISKELSSLVAMPIDQLLDRRYERLRKHGVFGEG